jgi:hypothetical protein
VTASAGVVTASTRVGAAATAAVCVALRAERAALRAAAGPVTRTGMGPRAAARAARRLAGRPVLVAGVGGGLRTDVRPGDLVVATEVRGPSGARWSCPSAPLLAADLRRRGLTVHLGPIASRPRVVDGAARRELSGTGALAVDTESAWLAPAGGPFAVVRAIVDTERAPLWRPGTAVRGIRALRALAAAVPAIDAWVAAARPRRVLLANPRSLRYATTNRQRAVGQIAGDCDLMLVLGSANSSNSARLVEVARREGVPARLVHDAVEVDLDMLAGAGRIGVTAGASTPPKLVDDLVACLRGLGPVTVDEACAEPENMRFTLPKEVT